MLFECHNNFLCLAVRGLSCLAIFLTWTQWVSLLVTFSRALEMFSTFYPQSSLFSKALSCCRITEPQIPTCISAWGLFSASQDTWAFRCWNIEWCCQPGNASSMWPWVQVLHYPSLSKESNACAWEPSPSVPMAFSLLSLPLKGDEYLILCVKWCPSCLLSLWLKWCQTAVARYFFVHQYYVSKGE